MHPVYRYLLCLVGRFPDTIDRAPWPTGGVRAYERDVSVRIRARCVQPIVEGKDARGLQHSDSAVGVIATDVRELVQVRVP